MSSVKVAWSVESASLGPQPPFGANLTRLTSAPLISDNIYGEQPRCTPDGTRIAFRRHLPGHPSQLWIADFARRRVGLVEGMDAGVATAKYTGMVYRVVGQGATRRLRRFDLATLDDTDVCDFSALPDLRAPCVSLDGRWYYGMRSQGPHQFDIIRVDLTSGAWTSIYADPDICNPHLQTCPATGALLVQHNRGCEFDADGQITHLVGRQGATLFVIDPDGSSYRQIPVGTPYGEYPATGHECWVGTTGWVAYTDARPAPAAVQAGNFLAARPGDAKAVPITTGYYFNHISVSACGRFFVCDATSLRGVPLVIGSMATGRSAMLCFSETTPGSPQWIHTHPYFTPDSRSVIFNSDRSGVPQIYRIEIPAGLLDGLAAPAGIGG
jgi:hypothetical protein